MLWRQAGIVTLGAILGGLCLYSYCRPGVLGPITAMEMRQKGIGREVQVRFRGRITSLNNSGFEIAQHGEPDAKRACF